MPRTSARVVCTLCETIAILDPTSAFSSVDLPALGAPIRATKPQCGLSTGATASSSARAGSPGCGRLEARPLLAMGTLFHTLARQHGGGGGLLSRAFGAPDPFGRSAVGKIYRHPELGVVMRPGAADLAINRRRKSTRLRPFLQHGLGIA